MYCNKCNMKNEDGSLFCTRCGEKLKFAVNKNQLNEDVIRAAADGDSYAMFIIADALFYGKGIAKNVDRAMILYKKSAQKGYAKAQNKLGVCLIMGDGIEKDLAKGIFWVVKAVEQNYAPAQCNLGDLLFKGIGVKKDYTKAFELYHKAAVNGNELAKFNLGKCYYNGYGTAQNKGKGIELIKYCADNGNQSAVRLLSELNNHTFNGTKRVEQETSTLDVANFENLYSRYVKQKQFFNAYVLMDTMLAKSHDNNIIIKIKDIMPDYWQVLGLSFNEVYKQNGLEKGLLRYIGIFLKNHSNVDASLTIDSVIKRVAYIVAGGFWYYVYQNRVYLRNCYLSDAKTNEITNLNFKEHIEKELEVIDLDNIQIDMNIVAKDLSKWIIVIYDLVLQNLKHKYEGIDFAKFEITYEQKEMIIARTLGKLQNNWGVFNAKFVQLKADKDKLVFMLPELEKFLKHSKKRDVTDIGISFLVNPVAGLLTTGRKMFALKGKYDREDSAYEKINKYYAGYIEKSQSLSESVDGFIVQLYEDFDRLGERILKDSLIKIINYLNGNGIKVKSVHELFK